MHTNLETLEFGNLESFCPVKALQMIYLPLEIKVHILLPVLVKVWNHSDLNSVKGVYSYNHNVLFCVFLSHVSHMHTHKREEKNQLPFGSGRHDSSFLFHVDCTRSNSVHVGHSHPTGVLDLWMKWPNSQMAVLIWLRGQGSVYEPSCSCILRRPLSPSPPNARVMAYLYTIIRQTHTYTLTAKSHQNKTHKQAHTWLAATLTQLQSLFKGGGLRVGDEGWKMASRTTISRLRWLRQRALHA